MEKALKNHLQTLLDFQQHLFEQGHTFWACDMEDKERKMPFYFYQRNRSRHMVTCSTCYKLMELRHKIRRMQKALGIPLTPFISHHQETEHVKRMSVNSSSEFNPNYAYL